MTRKERREQGVGINPVEYCPGSVNEGGVFEMRDHARYVAQRAGNLVREGGKDTRSTKQRKRDRRELREKQQTSFHVTLEETKEIQ